MTTNGSSTATIETLTAEVRVLMVGNRQVTLSVARQLDRAPLEEVEPFGRVRIGDEDNLIVGRRRSDGTLVLASYRSKHQSVLSVWITEDDLPGKITVCDRIQSNGGLSLRFGDRSIAVSDAAIERCGIHPWTPATKKEDLSRCEHWDAHECGEAIRACITRHDEEMARHVAAHSLPLIVLAGLK